MITKPVSKKQLLQWKRLYEENKSVLPDRADGEKTVRYFTEKYRPHEGAAEAFVQAARLNAEEQGSQQPKMRYFTVGEDLFVGVDTATGFFHVECEDIVRMAQVWDDLFLARGLSEEDKKNFVAVGQYLELSEKIGFSDIVGKKVVVRIERPKGSRHPNFLNLIYPIDYGYVVGETGGDGEAQDAYIFGADRTVGDLCGTVLAVYHRMNDIEDKWIVAVDGKNYSDEEILSAIDFQEKYYIGKLYRS